MGGFKTMADVLDGKRIADEIRAEIKTEVDALRAEGRRPPGLAVVLVGENPASQVYVGSKVKGGQELGVHSERYDPADAATAEELLALVGRLNADPTIDGILVQLPLPS